ASRRNHRRDIRCNFSQHLQQHTGVDGNRFFIYAACNWSHAADFPRMEVEMLCILGKKLTGVALMAAAAILLAACSVPVKEAKTAAQLRGRIEKALSQMEMTGTVPGLAHRHVTVDPESNGFAIKIYDVKLGTVDIGFQAFKEMTFDLARSDETHFLASNFKL